MSDMTPQEKKELYKRLDQIDSLNTKMDSISGTVSKLDRTLQSIFGNTDAPGSIGRLQQLEFDVKTLKSTHILNIEKRVGVQDNKIEGLEKLKNRMIGYIAGAAGGGASAGYLLNHLIGG